MDGKDYYEILGVSRDASDSEIKKAYRRLAHQYHPDKHKGDKEVEEKFKSVNEAYQALKDPARRAEYDRFGRVGAAGPGGYRDAGFGADFQDLFGEVFSDFFGGGARRPGPERGADLRYDLELTFEEAAFGTEKKVKVPRTVNCEGCGGTGARAGTEPVTCPNCRGRGQVSYQQGFLSIARTCSACGGEGRIIRDPCTDCAGSGKTRAVREISVKVPAGVNTGARLRLTAEGDFGERGGPPGDLYIYVSVAPHPIFSREGDDIICEVPISFPQAALGSEIEVPTLDGPAKLKVPGGTQSGKVFRLKHKGVANLRSGRRGDEQVVIKVETPSKLSRRQRELLTEFAEISGEDTTPLSRNFFSKVKEIFE